MTLSKVLQAGLCSVLAAAREPVSSSLVNASEVSCQVALAEHVRCGCRRPCLNVTRSCRGREPIYGLLPAPLSCALTSLSLFPYQQNLDKDCAYLLLGLLGTK